MSVERHRRLTELFLAACELDSERRGAFLGAECGGDEALRREVEEMLGMDEQSLPELRTPVTPSSTASAGVASEEETRRLAHVQRLVERAAAREYVVKGELARGGMGAILCVHDPGLRRDLAMKVSLRQLHGSSSGARPPGSAAELARFLEEAQITAQLDHPGIVPVHDLGVDPEGRLYFTMKLVEGRDLGEVLRRAQAGEAGWTRTRAVGILRQVCEAMAYAHDKGVVHRDLKPANVMVGEYGEVYVMDWGVARVAGTPASAQPGALAPVTTERAEERSEPGGDESALHTRAGAIVGTPHAMPPEQARGEPVGPPADVYAVGAMLYRLLAGRRPYEGETHDELASVVLARILRGPPRPLRELAPDAPAELVAIAERAMAPRPEQRYHDMRSLADDLRAYLEGRVVRAHRTGALAELAKWIARNRLAAAGIAATLVAVLGGLALNLWREARSRHELDLASDYYRARVVVESADELWPAAPATIPAIEDWIVRAEALLARRAAHAERLRRSEAAAGADAAEAARQRALLGYLDALDGTDSEAPALLAAVRTRLEFARTIAERSVTGSEVAALWREACSSIRAGDSHPGYAGLELAPQLGLVPLGPDPECGLWEFAHLETGVPAKRDGDGELVMRPEIGLVFVLIPAGTFRMGASRVAGQPNFDPSAFGNETPVQELSLAPCFLSKYEMTQAQWERVTGRNPSKWPPGAAPTVTPRNPVEQVSWYDASEVLGRMALVLPTEALWEYACRAGTDTPFVCDSADVGLFANVGDQSYARQFADVFDFEPFDDGFAYHAPVGSLEPNAFGLHDVHGNVGEWVLDPYGSFAHPRRAGDGLSLGPQGPGAPWWSPDYRVVRSGFFEVPALYSRASHRVNFAPGVINHGIGVRPAREIDPPASER